MPEKLLTYFSPIGRATAALFIATAFLLILMVGSAQQEAITTLSIAKSEMSYSVARDLAITAKQQSQDLRAVEIENRNLRAQNRKLKLDGDKPDAELSTQLGTVSRIAQTIARSNACEALPPDGVTGDVAAMWNAIESCAAAGHVSPAIQAELREMRVPDRNPGLLIRRIKELSKLIAANEEVIADNQAKIEKLTGEIAAAQTATNSLRDITTLEGIWLVRVSGVTRLPPAMLAIMLCFLSGLFGGMLITLILAVYPKNDFKFAVSDSYWSRMLLGGLIAVCVFVVLGGGIAVLGAQSNPLNGSANFMSFCAIGLLAGMFSDRVARWLSARANLFVDEDAKLPPKPPAPPKPTEEPAMPEPAPKPETEESPGVG